MCVNGIIPPIRTLQATVALGGDEWLVIDVSLHETAAAVLITFSGHKHTHL